MKPFRPVLKQLFPGLGKANVKVENLRIVRKPGVQQKEQERRIAGGCTGSPQTPECSCDFDQVISVLDAKLLVQGRKLLPRA